MATPTGSLEQLLDVETPEQVVVSYTLAGIGSRAAAALIDTLILVVSVVGMWILLAAVGAGVVGATSATWVGSYLVAFLMIFSAAVLWGYYVLFEALWDGQTPGKRAIGLRVVRDGGFPVTFAASAVRNIVRIADIQPIPTYFVAIVSAIVSRSGKRLGDYAAGTIVVREREVTEVTPFVRPSRAGASGDAPDAVVPTTRLTDDEFALLDRFMQRRATLDPPYRQQFASELAARFRVRAADLAGADDEFVATLFDAERGARQRGAAARSDTGAAREQHALVAEGSERWHEFAVRLAAARRRGMAHLSEDDVSDLVARYREASTDLARLTTATRGRDNQALWYLNRLVATGHAFVYGDRPIAPRSIWRYMMRTVPLEIRRSWRPILLAATLLFGPAIIVWVAIVRDPSIAPEFVSPSMLDRADQGVRWAKEGSGYIPDNPLVRPIMSSAVISNNVWMSFFAFAGGTTAGVWTAWSLIYNGVSIGAVPGLYQTKGILPLFIAFVAPHGVLELSAICLAGGAGFLIAAALIMPGALTRREALVANGARAIRLIAGTTLLLVVAGMFEGLVSPIPWWSLTQKATVSLLTAVVLASYVSLRDIGANPAK